VNWNWRAFFAGSILTLLSAGLVSAQTIPFDFNLTITANGLTEVVDTNNDQVPISGAGSLTVIATYTGSTMATLSAPIVQGAVGFSAVFVNATAPVVLTPGGSVTFKVTYTPTNASEATAQIEVPYTETISGEGTISNAIIIVAQATSPAVSLVYALAPNNNFLSISSGGTIQFPPTALNTTATATLDVRNTGSGPAEVTGITLPASTSPFQLEGVPPASAAIPYTIAADMALPIGIQYTPTAVEKDTAQFTVSFSDGTTDVINLAGSGATSTFTYTVVSGTTTTTVKAGGTITLPPVTVPTTATTTTASSSVIVQVKNTGNANGVINSINAGPFPPFAVSGQPTTPPTLTPGGSENFSVTFTPVQVGVQTGTLLVGNDTFTLSGTGLAPLSYSYVSNGATVPVPSGGTVVFPNIAVSKSETENFTATNTGTSNVTVSLVSTTSPFSVPSFAPTTLTPGQSTTFPITFTPTATGPVTGTLLINSTTIQLVGAGTAPPNLPSYTISGPSGDVQPASQEPVTLSLASTYPVDLEGVLTITTSGNFGTDPAAQFEVGSSTGNRTVDFTIPAGSTSANFAGQGSQIFLQTGTVAETIILTPTFATASGIDLTPTSPSTLEFTIPSSAPFLESVAVTNVVSSPTDASFTLAIVGYSTTRDLTSLSVTLTPASGFKLTTTQLTTPLTGVANLWFQSTASQAFGGLFQVNETYTLTGSLKANQTLLNAIASVSATMTNSVGTSAAIQASF